MTRLLCFLEEMARLLCFLFGHRWSGWQRYGNLVGRGCYSCGVWEDMEYDA